MLGMKEQCRLWTWRSRCAAKSYVDAAAKPKPTRAPKSAATPIEREDMEALQVVGRSQSTTPGIERQEKAPPHQQFRKKRPCLASSRMPARTPEVPAVTRRRYATSLAGAASRNARRAANGWSQ